MSHSKKFCEPVGICSIFRVASWAKMIKNRAAIQLTSIEFVIGKSNTRAISTAFCDSSCVSPAIVIMPPHHRRSCSPIILIRTIVLGEGGKILSKMTDETSGVFQCIERSERINQYAFSPTPRNISHAHSTSSGVGGCASLSV